MIKNPVKEKEKKKVGAQKSHNIRKSCTVSACHCLSVYLPGSACLSLSVCVCQSACLSLSACLPVCLCLFASLPAYLPVSLPVHLCVCLPVCLPISLSACLYISVCVSFLSHGGHSTKPVHSPNHTLHPQMVVNVMLLIGLLCSGIGHTSTRMGVGAMKLVYWGSNQ